MKYLIKIVGIICIVTLSQCNRCHREIVNANRVTKGEGITLSTDGKIIDSVRIVVREHKFNLNRMYYSEYVINTMSDSNGKFSFNLKGTPSNDTFLLQAMSTKIIPSNIYIYDKYNIYFDNPEFRSDKSWFNPLGQYVLPGDSVGNLFLTPRSILNFNIQLDSIIGKFDSLQVRYHNSYSETELLSFINLKTEKSLDSISKNVFCLQGNNNIKLSFFKNKEETKKELNVKTDKFEIKQIKIKF
jgi:hypothetical protein